MTNDSRVARRWFWTMTLVGTSGFLMGFYLQPIHLAQAQIRKSTPAKVFQSGGARSERVLKEILKTLQTIDGRVERMESTLASISRDKKTTNK